MIAEMGHEARQHPEELIYERIASGFVTLSYDGRLRAAIENVRAVADLEAAIEASL